ncbi:POK9 protein, partial [Calyptomena viridis]|nr:POK9 protein [Calyptomena viridis]
RGSAGLDVATATTVTITDRNMIKIPPGIFDLLGGQCSALLLGRSSTTLQGLFVLLGVMDADYKGEIHIMAWTPNPPCTIAAGSRIAQLILFQAIVPQSAACDRGAGSFGSTGQPVIAWTQSLSTKRPVLTCVVRHSTSASVVIQGLLDTGADITVIA